MGLVSFLKSFTRVVRFNTTMTDVKVDIGGNTLKTLEHFSSPGDDSHPLPNDYVASISQSQTGRQSAIGYHDPVNEAVTLPGGKRIYARDSQGNIVSQVWLKNDSEIQINNDNGFITLLANGDINLNNVIIKPNGNVIMPNSLVLDGKEIDDHVHSGVQSGSSNTGPNV